MSKCPSGALKPIPRESIKMGIARIDATHCLVWNGEDAECRICIEMCPLTGSAIALDGEMENEGKGPAVHENACTGCGVCEYYCPSGPTAIIVEPTQRVA
jgi:NAD-dependent dihydropyrimidine dehydrogenase PreA subunit